jgi:hypothetical protein
MQTGQQQEEDIAAAAVAVEAILQIRNGDPVLFY